MRIVVKFSFLFLFASFTYSHAANADSARCPVDPQWLKAPSLPVEVKRSAADGSSTFCDFYQFANQTYLYLMSPATSGGGLRNFQVNGDFPVLEFNDDNTPANSCNSTIEGKTLRSSLDKTRSVSTGQAGGGATIYDTQGNVVYYDVRFSKNLCNLSSSAVELNKKNITNFPAGSMELKFAWKVLGNDEITSKGYVTVDNTIDGKRVTLGLVGMHIARATKNHPEFVWATYEHNTNAPDCTPPGMQSKTPWSFASQACTSGLPGSAMPTDNCKFNQPPKNATAPKGTPTNICRVHPFGTASGDLKAGENLFDIAQQNTGVQDLVSATGVPQAMIPLKNYFNVGGLWVSDITQSSGGVGVPNERGSLRLANSTAETDYQHVDLASSEFISNCFGCHNYKGTSASPSNNITTQALSHTFLDIKIGQNKAVDVSSTKTISDNSAAKKICSGDGDKILGTCANAAPFLVWNGNWTNINASAGSVCGCKKK